METIISYTLGVISAVIVNFLVNKWTTERERISILRTNRMKYYSEIVPFLYWPYNSNVSDNDLIIKFSSAVLVSDDYLIKDLEEFQNILLKNRYEIMKRKIEDPNFIQEARVSKYSRPSFFVDKHDEIEIKGKEILFKFKKYITEK